MTVLLELTEMIGRSCLQKKKEDHLLIGEKVDLLNKSFEIEIELN